MSDLTLEVTPYGSEGVDWDEELAVMDAAEANFSYWQSMPFWTLDEGIALLLGKEPTIVNWDVIRHYVHFPYATELCARYKALRTLALRALQVKEIEDPMEPAAFLAWAGSRGLEAPPTLCSPLPATHYKNNLFNEIVPVACLAAPDPAQNLENLLTQKEEAISALTQRIVALEAQLASKALVWESADPSKSTYSRALAAAVEAHAEVSKNGKTGSSIKQQLSAWLKAHYPDLSKEMRDYIASVCNWQKKGGAPRTL